MIGDQLDTRIRRPFVASEPVSDVKENVAHKAGMSFKKCLMTFTDKQ